MNRLRIWFARARLRSIRHDIETHDRYIRTSAATLDRLLLESRVAEGELFRLENPGLFNRQAERSRVYS
jgi:hypothetical protein